MPPRRLRAALIFDLDDTLHRGRRFVISGFAAVAACAPARWGLPCEHLLRLLLDAVRRGRVAVAFQCACAAAGLPLRCADEMLEVYRAHTPRLKLPRESARCLTACRARWPTGILTNGHPVVQRSKIAALGLAPLVDAVVYAHAVADQGKPDPHVFDAMVEALDSDPACTIMVGNDRHTDIWGALNAGLRAVWLARQAAQWEDDWPRAVRISRLAELPAVAEKMLGTALSQ